MLYICVMYNIHTHIVIYNIYIYTTNADVKCVHHQPDDHQMIPVQ